MKSDLHQLPDDQAAILLAYLCDELPAQDRAKVREMIAAVPALAAALDEMAGALQSSMAAMESLDGGQPLGSESAAVGRVVRVMKQSKLQRAAPAAKVVELRRFPRWLYLSPPVAAAALVLFALWTAYLASPAKINEGPHPRPPRDRREMVETQQPLQTLLVQSFELSAADDADNLQLVSAARDNDEADMSLESPRANDSTAP